MSPHVHPTPHSGAGMRGHFQCKHLSKLWPITLATDSGIYDVTDGDFTLRVANPVPEMRSQAAYARSLFTRKHYLYEKFNCHHWEIPELNSFSHVIVHYSALLDLLPRDIPQTTTVIFDTHNNEREYFESVAAQSLNPVKRVVIRNQANVAERVIRRSRTLIAATISVSEGDRDWVSPLCASETEHFVVPNNLFRYSPTAWSGNRTILFIGSLNVTMNLQALDWFVRRVWPKLRASVPDANFVVAGRDPSQSLISDLENQGVRVVPNAPSLTKLYEEAMCSLIPALSGSGAKIKVCESLAHGVPVITTTHGLVGQPAAIKECCTVHDSPDDWLQALQKQLAAGERSTPAWDNKVETVLNQSYFGESIKQVAAHIQAG